MSTLLTLPTELLIQILTLVSSSKSDLYHLLQASKKLLPLLKPLLYHSNTITDRATRHLLENVNEEDSKRVRKLVIRGHDNLDPYTIGIDDEDDSAPYDEDKVGQGCFRDLLEGNLLDLSCEFEPDAVTLQGGATDRFEIRRRHRDSTHQQSSGRIEVDPLETFTTRLQNRFQPRRTLSIESYRHSRPLDPLSPARIHPESTSNRILLRYGIPT